jgi:hypothetical protein
MTKQSQDTRKKEESQVKPRQKEVKETKDKTSKTIRQIVVSYSNGTLTYGVTTTLFQTLNSHPRHTSST